MTKDLEVNVEITRILHLVLVLSVVLIPGASDPSKYVLFYLPGGESGMYLTSMSHTWTSPEWMYLTCRSSQGSGHLITGEYTNIHLLTDASKYRFLLVKETRQKLPSLPSDVTRAIWFPRNLQNRRFFRFL